MKRNELDSAFFESIQGGILSKDKSKIYFVGIIDTLTYFGKIKMMEYGLKNIIYGNAMSCLPPARYADRFLNYIKDSFK
jgi:1-phosphatidylinositol-4-phosphate 5-kinase